MAEYTIPQKNDAGGWIGYVALVDASDGKSFKANPTLATGDAKVSIDGGAFANLGTIPAVDPAAGIAVKVTLSQAEINGDNIVITLIDQDATKEWADLAINLQPATNKLEDVALEATVTTVDTVVDAIKVVTDALPDSGALTSLATASALTTVDTVVDAIKVITDALGATAAANLALSCGAAGIVTGTAQTGTLSTTVMTSDLSETTDDHYIGRVIIWTSGALIGQATDITDYSGTNGTLTYTLVTDAPSNGDTFIIV